MLLQLLLMRLLLHEMLRRQMAQSLRIGHTASHALTPHTRLSIHSHRSCRSWVYRPIRSVLHPHHRARLADMLLAGPRHAARVHHLLIHVLCLVLCQAWVAVWMHTRMLHAARLWLVRRSHHRGGSSSVLPRLDTIALLLEKVR